MRIAFKITAPLRNRLLAELRQRHAFAAERVGFLSCKLAALKPSGWVVLARDFHSVADDDYVRDTSVGAMMGAAAIRKALQIALNQDVSMFHVHLHEHSGIPRFSAVDLRETAKFVPDFWHIRPNLIHGAVVASTDSFVGLCWHPHAPAPLEISDFSVVGAPMRLLRSKDEGKI